MTLQFELQCPISTDLALIRDLIRVHGRHCGLPADRLEDLVVAVNEAVTNVLDHGGRTGMVTSRGGADGVIVEILDVAGRLTHEHLSSARLDPTASHGYGLWVIQQLCDEVVLEQTGLGSLLTLDLRTRRHAGRLDARRAVSA
ncbi:ATP-binding protein [Nonomuraea sp. NPDC049684]|uniref:ATP-binding protein n=1 Tax=unclassified Nonomuraea TaxID=2593643 RepID=UPI0037A1EC84